MGRNSGGNKASEDRWDDMKKTKGKPPKNIEDLRNIKDPQTFRDVKQAISRFHSVLGVRERAVKLADLDGGVLGEQHTAIDGTRVGIYLNKDFFNQKRDKIVKDVMRDYTNGWSTKTNKPIAHVVTHELAHATWNSTLKEPKHKAAGKEIKNLAEAWLKDPKKKGYGKYAKTNPDEFFAECVTKAVHGKQDKYTKALKSIIKKYNL